ncbi:MAG: toll/interleukin-1 receptor domain-containing protein [Phycisphaeraceae bacterium]|nr:toll/interleukin-1 receptor domain-containing protein [Phycisphaeraceae bacterium]
MKVFLSYSNEDSQFAGKLAAALERHGLRVWRAESMLPGDNWADEVSRALRSSDAMVVLISPASMKSPWVLKEIEFALGSPRFSHRLVPVVIRATPDAPWILRNLEMMDANQNSVEHLATSIADRLSVSMS